MKLLGSTKNKITKDKSGENVPHLEITEVKDIAAVNDDGNIINFNGAINTDYLILKIN